jgi:hypothetical protein
LNGCQPVKRNVVEHFIEAQHIIGGDSISSQLEEFFIDPGDLPNGRICQPVTERLRSCFFEAGRKPKPCPYSASFII